MGRGVDTEALGAVARAARLRRGVSLARLAEAAGVSKAALVGLEAGRGNPTLSTLAAVADALGVSISDLIEPGSSKIVEVVDSAEVEPLWRDDLGSSATLLFTTPGATPAEVWSWRLAPGAVYQSHPHPDGITESIVVASGTLLLTVGTQQVEVGTGCAATFDASEPHTYAAVGDTPTAFTMTVHLRPGGAEGRST